MLCSRRLIFTVSLIEVSVKLVLVSVNEVGVFCATNQTVNVRFLIDLTFCGNFLSWKLTVKLVLVSVKEVEVSWIKSKRGRGRK